MVETALPARRVDDLQVLKVPAIESVVAGQEGVRLMPRVGADHEVGHQTRGPLDALRLPRQSRPAKAADSGEIGSKRTARVFMAALKLPSDGNWALTSAHTTSQASSAPAP